MVATAAALSAHEADVREAYLARKQPEIEELVSSLVNSMVAARAEDLCDFTVGFMRATASCASAPPADVPIATHETGDWSSTGWLTSQGIPQCVASALLQDFALSEMSELEAMRSLVGESDAQLVHRLDRGSLVQRVALQLKTRLKTLCDDCPADGEDDISWCFSWDDQQTRSHQSKFVHDSRTFELQYASLNTFFGGLEAKIGAPDVKIWEAMEREHTNCADSQDFFVTLNYGLRTCPETEWYFVTDPQPGLGHWPVEERCAEGLRRSALDLDKLSSDDSLESRLELINERLRALDAPDMILEEAFVKYNDLLRGFGPALAGCKDNCYVTTLHVINSCIVKSSKLTKVAKVFRGVAGGRLPESFLQPNEYNIKGGVESAFMSTTFDRSVALEYAGVSSNGAVSSRGPAVIFEMQMGMADRGCELSWLSQYPHERECLFPPLSGIEVLATRVEGAILVVEARLSVDMNALTIEQVMGKRQRLLVDMARGMRLEVNDELLRRPEWRAHPEQVALRAEWAELQVERQLAMKWEPTYFNNDDNFSSAIGAALRIKQQVLTGAPFAGSASKIPMRDMPWPTESLPEWVNLRPEMTAMNYLQLFGKHSGFVRTPSAPQLVSGKGNEIRTFSRDVLIKVTNSAEYSVYAPLVHGHMSSAATEVQSFVPRCLDALHGSLQVANTPHARVLFLTNVAAHMSRPCALDLKMGTRTWREEEAKDSKLRADLYQKAVGKLRAERMLSNDDLEARAVTKIRYKQLRDACCSTATLGLRVEAATIDGVDMLPEIESQLGKSLPLIESRTDVRAIIQRFLSCRPEVRHVFLQRIRMLQQALESSEWFLTHEFVASSLLFVYDMDGSSDASPAVWMIDFNSVRQLREGDTITHRKAWMPGSHEDGYLTGIDSLVDIWQEIEEGMDESSCTVADM